MNHRRDEYDCGGGRRKGDQLEVKVEDTFEEDDPEDRDERPADNRVQPIVDSWVAPRRLIRYDGSPEDLLLAGSFAAPTLVLLDGPVLILVVLLLAVSFVYVVLRRWLADLAPAVFSKVPEPIEEYVPDRYTE